MLFRHVFGFGDLQPPSYPPLFLKTMGSPAYHDRRGKQADGMGLYDTGLGAEALDGLR